MIAASKTSHKGPFIQNTVSNQSCQSRWKTLGSDLLQKKGLCQVDIVGPVVSGRKDNSVLKSQVEVTVPNTSTFLSFFIHFFC